MPKVRSGMPMGSHSMGTTPETIWLYVLIAIELATLGALRRYFRREHGG